MQIRRVNGWLVSSERDAKIQYVVETLGDGAWRCDCRDYQYRGMARYCKHVRAVQEMLAKNVPEPARLR